MPPSRGSSQPQGWNPGLPHCRRVLYHLSQQGSPLVSQEQGSPHADPSLPGLRLPKDELKRVHTHGPSPTKRLQPGLAGCSSSSCPPPPPPQAAGQLTLHQKAEQPICKPAAHKGRRGRLSHANANTALPREASAARPRPAVPRTRAAWLCYFNMRFPTSADHHRPQRVVPKGDRGWGGKHWKSEVDIREIFFLSTYS